MASGKLTPKVHITRPLGRLPGLLKHLAKDRPITIEKMNAEAKQRVAESFKRSVKQ